MSNRHIVCALILSIILTGCSRKKNTFISRNLHAVGTEYNILYNGNLALERGRQSVDDAFTENYWELLPVERMQISDEVLLPGQSRNQDFKYAEEKAIKAVQKHGMNIKGKEYNPQIDEAYLLLGKSRYFDQRFVPALQAFNYILYKYPASDKINAAKIWREKTNMRLDNDVLAIKNLKRLMDREELEAQDLADANATLAQAYINLESKDSALVHLKRAAELTKNHKEEARYWFIRGQLFNEFGMKDSANHAFTHIIDLHRKIPRAYYINAHMERAANFNMETGDKMAYLEYLTDLEENRENRPFLDKIYYRKAEYYTHENRDSLAEMYYNKSLRTNTQDQHLRSLDYNTLGDMYFDRNEYRLAGAYYDSTMLNQVVDTKPYRIIKKKRENLDDVILYESIAQANDSILQLVGMPEIEREAYFTAYTEKLKEIAEAEREKAEILERNNAGLVVVENQLSRSLPGLPTQNNRNSSTFYFYNPQTVAYGKNEFTRIWGNRALADNWRWSDQRQIAIQTPEDIVNDSLAEIQKFDPSFYISQIPSEPAIIDSLKQQRNYAYYQLGIIYKEKFQEFALARHRLENLLKSNPEPRLILPAKYNLYKIYEELGEAGLANAMKEEIVSNYPDSRYAEILANPDSLLAKDQNSAESIYEELFARYEAQEFGDVIEEAEKYIDQMQGDPIVPKFEFLKASAKGRLYGFEAYKEGINYIAVTYPNTEEGKRAEEMMQKNMPVLAEKTFVADEDVNHKVLYPFKTDEYKDIPEFMAKLNEIIKDIKFYNLKLSVDTYDENTKFVVLHGLLNSIGAEGFAEVLKEKEYNIKRPYYTISTPNYAIILTHKNLQEYLELQ
ncbi:type IX secretion system periplasmic lipoprotein PorW/SprE [Aegicerativicinus sediminis]